MFRSRPKWSTAIFLAMVGALAIFAGPAQAGNAEVAVNSPAAIAGDYSAGQALYSPTLTLAGITKDVELVNDGSTVVLTTGTGTVTDGCQAPTNNVTDKFVLVDRGACSFPTKSQNAQNAGAAGVIIANNTCCAEFTVGGALPGATIPTVSVTQTTGTTLKSGLTSGVVNATMRADDHDGDLEADTTDIDDDNDGKLDTGDFCGDGELGWTSDPSTDNDSDGCRDSTEDLNDDNDGLEDGSDTCPLEHGLTAPAVPSGRSRSLLRLGGRSPALTSSARATATRSTTTGPRSSSTATPNSGCTFAGWSGACSGTGNCDLTMSADRSVTASFAAVLPPLLQSESAPTGQRARPRLGSAKRRTARRSGGIAGEGRTFFPSSQKR